MAETCPVMKAGSFTPSMCKSEAGGNSSTAALVDAHFASILAGYKEGAADPATYYPRLCGQDVKVKAGVDNGWACAYYYVLIRNVYYCNKDWVCGSNPEEDKPACESMSAMLTAVCDTTADKIKGEIDSARAGGACKNKADGGEEFAPPAPPTPHASGLKCLLGKNGVDPVSTVVDANCCNTPGSSGTPVCVRFCNKDKKVTYEGVDKNVADLFVDDPTGETWGATSTLVCDTDDCNIKIDKPCDYVPVTPSPGFSTLRSGQGPALTLMVGLLVLYAGTC